MLECSYSSINKKRKRISKLSASSHFIKFFKKITATFGILKKAKKTQKFSFQGHRKNKPNTSLENKCSVVYSQKDYAKY